MQLFWLRNFFAANLYQQKKRVPRSHLWTPGPAIKANVIAAISTTHGSTVAPRAKTHFLLRKNSGRLASSFHSTVLTSESIRPKHQRLRNNKGSFFSSSSLLLFCRRFTKTSGSWHVKSCHTSLAYEHNNSWFYVHKWQTISSWHAWQYKSLAFQPYAFGNLSCRISASLYRPIES